MISGIRHHGNHSPRNNEPQWVATTGAGGDAPPRHCRMQRAPEGEDEDDDETRLYFSSQHHNSNSTVKHFSHRRRHCDIQDSLSLSPVQLVEQVRTAALDRSPTKPERTYSLSLSGRIPTRCTSSSKEEEKARQFLKEVEDRKALKSLKAQTLRMADLPAQPGQSRRGSGDVSLRSASVIPPPPLDGQRAATRAPSSRFMASPPTPLVSDGAALLSALSSSTHSFVRSAPPSARIEESYYDSSYRQLMSLPASRYSTCSVLPLEQGPGHPDVARCDRTIGPHSRRPCCAHPHRHPHPQRPPSHCTPVNHHRQHSSRDIQATESPGSSLCLRSPVSPVSPLSAPASAVSSPSSMAAESHGRRPHRMLIQVAPGVQASLRSSDETWEAIQNDFYMPGLCLGCDLTLFAIQDAAYLLCPDCHTVSPMDGTFVDKVNAGVGLGFKYDDLVRWQLELVEENKRCQR